MRNLKQVSAGVLLMTAVIVGCGQIIGNNPIGVTGGGQDGYGSTGTGIVGELDPRLFGTWLRPLNPLESQEYIFLPDGRCELWYFNPEVGHLLMRGNYKAFANRIEISSETIELGFYWVTGDALLLNLSGVSTTWTRVYYP